MTTAADIAEDAIPAMAAMIDLSVPAACLPGVVANLRLLAEHTARLPLAEDGEP